MCKDFWGMGDRDWTIMFVFCFLCFFFHAAQGSMLVFFFMTISRQKIVVLEYKYNIMLTVLFTINS